MIVEGTNTNSSSKKVLIKQQGREYSKGIRNQSWWKTIRKRFGYKIKDAASNEGHGNVKLIRKRICWYEEQ